MARMQRRTWIKFGLVGGAVLALGGGTLALLRPAWTGSRLTPAGRELFGAVARAVLEGILPEAQRAPQAHQAALAAHLERLDATLAGLPSAMQDEIAQLGALLLHPLGRRTLAGLGTDWVEADTAAVQHALHGLRESPMALRQQAYHALRDLTNGAYFSDPTAWSYLGYPGPRPV